MGAELFRKTSSRFYLIPKHGFRQRLAILFAENVSVPVI
jgi:hypothetical protein